MSGYLVREFEIDDFDEAISLWRLTEGIGLGDSDTRQGIASFLERNPGTSFVAILDGRLVGAVLCGHDGRRGYLHHLAVETSCRGKGIGKALVESCLSALDERGIRKCNIFVYSRNRQAREFWQYHNWKPRTDLEVLQKLTNDVDCIEQS